MEQMRERGGEGEGKGGEILVSSERTDESSAQRAVPGGSVESLLKSRTAWEESRSAQRTREGAARGGTTNPVVFGSRWTGRSRGISDGLMV
jgi:hypothetical protein